MDRYLLDTNAASGLLKGSQPILTRRSSVIPTRIQFIPSVVRAELLFGWRSSSDYAPRIAHLQTFLTGYPSLPFDDVSAEEYGKIRAHLRASGMMIGPNDLMIASIALANRLVLVTHNTAEFSRVPGLRLGYWQSRSATYLVALPK